MIVTASRGLLLLGSLASASACAPAPTPAAPPPAPAPAPAPEPAPAPVVEPAPSPAPAEPTFDPATATSLRVVIVAIPNRKSWVPCGVHHSIGALEVEVLDVGEPRPRMLLLISCPVDSRRNRPALVVGSVLDVTLHTRKQPWPAVSGLSKELPRRQVASFAWAPK